MGQWCSLLSHRATSRKVLGSIPDGVTGIFHWHKPSGRIMALGLTQCLTKMNTRNISWRGKGGRCIGLTTLRPSCTVVLKSGSHYLLEPSGAVMGLLLLFEEKCSFVLYVKTQFKRSRERRLSQLQRRNCSCCYVNNLRLLQASYENEYS